MNENLKEPDRGLSIRVGAAILGLVVVLALSVYSVWWIGDAPPAGSSGTVGQATQNPGPAQTNR
jgi:hypothetical protein